VDRDQGRIELGQHDNAAQLGLHHDSHRLCRSQPNHGPAPPAAGLSRAAGPVLPRGDEDGHGDELVAKLHPAVDQRVTGRAVVGSER
jgi:hypothetical protein